MYTETAPGPAHCSKGSEILNSRMVLAYLSKSLSSSSRVGGLGVGAKFSPLEMTEAAESVSVKEERFVMCFLCCCLWISLKYVLLGSFL